MKKIFTTFLLFGIFYANADDDQDELREIYGKLEEITHRVDLLEKKVSTVSLSTDEVSEVSGDKSKSGQNDQYEKYIKGLSPEDVIKKAKKYFDDDRYGQGRGILNSFILKNPKSIYCGMMQYYIGKSYFKEKNFEKAANAFIECFGTNPNGAKTPKALYLMAECFKKLDKSEQAKKTLEKLIDTYPNSKYVKKAKKLKKKLKKS